MPFVNVHGVLVLLADGGDTNTRYCNWKLFQLFAMQGDGDPKT